MSKLAFSNIGLTPYDHHLELIKAAELGFMGLEVAPSRVWESTWEGLKTSHVKKYLREVEAAGLEVCGFHSLFFDKPHLGIFVDRDTALRTADFLVHLSGVCRDLGGHTLVFGSPRARARGQLGYEQAFDEATSWLESICRRIADHGTYLCFEPLGPNESDFLNSALESKRLVEAVGHPSLRVQLDAKALWASNEMTCHTVRAVAEMLVHVHINEPDLGPLRADSPINHVMFSRFLQEQTSYQGYCSLEQRMIDEDPIPALRQSIEVLDKHYR